MDSLSPRRWPVSLRRVSFPCASRANFPANTFNESYNLEYGQDALEMHTDAIVEGESVLIVDDVIATGGTAAAAVNLLERAGAKVAGVTVFIELGFLNGRDAIEGVPFHALLRYD